MIYLASPYRHPDRSVIRRRVFLTALAFARLAAREGQEKVYSPVLHGHAIDRELRSRKRPVPPDRYWLDHGLEMLRLCSKMYIFMLPGWEESQGIREERIHCERNRITVLYLDHKLNFVEPDDHASPIERPPGLQDNDSWGGTWG